MKKVVVAGAWLVFFLPGAIAQDDTYVPPPSSGYTWSASDLQKLVAPIALYPDPLLAELLPASTFPSEVVEADRYLSEGGDPNAISEQPWDPSVQALAHYPNVLKWMDDNLPWVTQLGEAFQNQQPDVMSAIQTLRAQAQNLGNLQNSPQEDVVNDDGDIEIEPANPDDMYVPTYDWNTIYYDPGIYCSFGLMLPLGGWLGYGWDWHAHHLFYWHGGLPGNWWHESAGWRHGFIADHHAPAWHTGGFAARGGWERGFAAPARSFEPRIPREAAPRVGGVTPGVTVIGRSAGSRAFGHEAAPRESFVPREEGAFGGSGTEAHAWSSRGESSRAAGGFESHGGGGGFESHGGGGGGGGFGGHGGGGGGRH